MNIKQTIGETTEKIEQKAKELWTNYSPYYANLEPWQRGLVLLGILVAIALIIYLLTSKDKEKLERREAKREALAEERLLKRMELLKKLKE